MVPKAMRLQLGMEGGSVELAIEGSSLRVTPVAGEDLREVDGRLVIPATGTKIDDELIRRLRYADQR